MARRKDYVPESDVRLDEWQGRFVEQANAMADELGPVAEHLPVLNAAHEAWAAKRKAQLDARAAARVATRAKNEARAELKRAIRLVAGWAQTWPETTDDMRARLGITVPDRSPTRTSVEAIGNVPAPRLYIDHSVAAQATIHFGPRPRDERRNGIPKGAFAADIRFCVGGIPKDESRWKRLALDKHSPYVHRVAPGTRVAYRARWIDRLGRPGPFGSPTEVIVSV